MPMKFSIFKNPKGVVIEKPLPITPEKPKITQPTQFTGMFFRIQSIGNCKSCGGSV